MRAHILLLLGVLACVPAQPAANGSDSTPRPSTTGADTLRGIVRVVGSDPATWLVIYPGYTAPQSLSGTAAERLRSVSGADVWISGRGLEGHFEVERFVVRAIDGKPVHDGVLTGTDGVIRIELTGGGTVPIENPPPQLDALLGRRVWVSRAAPGEGLSYGEIR